MTAYHLSAVFVVVVLFSAPANAAEKSEFPKYAAVKKTVKKSLTGRRGYHAGDILSRRDVEKALDAVAKTGWKVADRKAILAQVLTDNDYLVRQLRTRRGIPFMRKLSGTAAAYDRLDRLRRLKYGNRRIREFINNPGGHTMILYMATTRGGKNLGKYLAAGKNGKNFNKPTRRIYQEHDLLKRLKKSYDAEVKRRTAGHRKKPKPAKPPAG